jgi:apolipoprotein N-acyltransferase
MKVKLILLALISGILFPIAVPNQLFIYGNFLIGLICLFPFFYSLKHSPGIRFSILLGIIFGGISTILANYWLFYFNDYRFWTIGSVTFGYIGYNALLAPFLWKFMKVRSPWTPFAVAAAWTVYEFFKSVGYLAYPWGLIAYPATSISALIQHVDILGVWSLSFIMACINAVFCETADTIVLLNKLKFKTIIHQWSVIFCIVGIALIYGYVMLERDFDYSKTFDVLLVQQNADPWLFSNKADTVKIAQDLTREGLQKAPIDPDLIVWSESSLSQPYPDAKAYYRRNPEEDPFLSFLNDLPVMLFTGGPIVLDWENLEAMNSALLITPAGDTVNYYGKQHPVPFAENVPYWENPIIRGFMQNVIVLNSMWTMGDEYTIFTIPLKNGEFLKFGSPICFEDAFAYICRNFTLAGSELFINLTNDSWSQTESAQIQHSVTSLYRAIENRRVLVRSTNGGHTVIYGPHGEIIDELPMFVGTTLFASFPVYTTKRFTPYTLYGDYFPYFLLIILFVLLLMQKKRLLPWIGSSRKTDNLFD